MNGSMQQKTCSNLKEELLAAIVSIMDCSRFFEVLKGTRISQMKQI